ncbi:MAG: DNA alkylation repair protein [Ilumatobacter sp.]|nr:DNA alkylation repair protein [Ilumatobacter sp.]
MSWVDDTVDRAVTALDGRGDPERADGAERYMKHIAPFIGLTAGERRSLLREAWRDVSAPTSDQLGEAGMRLMGLDEREYHYAAADLADRFVRHADAEFLDRWGERLLTTTPWWDTVDGFGSSIVSPLGRRFDVTATIDRWSESGDIWLIRAAIQHQRGWRDDTDIVPVLELCDRHWSNREFFVAKAIGWALRDLTRLDPAAVRSFLAAHPEPNRVAVREAERGLSRAGQVSEVLRVRCRR